MFHVERDRPASDEPSDDPTAILAAGLAELALPADLAAPLAALATLLAQWAARMNLTGHRTPAAIARRLILDALALGSALPGAGEPGDPGPASLADLGSGAGFPGLPLAIRWPRCRVTLVEARERRHHFQWAAVRTLGLVNVEPRRGRIEALAPEPHAIVVAQALAQPDQAVAWMLPWVAPGGWLVLPRTADAPELPPVPGLVDAQLRSYQVPLEGPARALWMARRPPDALDAPSAAVVRTRRPPD